jgi:hypothetical protein
MIDDHSELVDDQGIGGGRFEKVNLMDSNDSMCGNLCVNSNRGEDYYCPFSQIVRIVIYLISMIDMIFSDMYSKVEIHFPLPRFVGEGERSKLSIWYYTHFIPLLRLFSQHILDFNSLLHSIIVCVFLFSIY